ncbi:carboxyltransferase domain-containing protein [Curtobacterium pusillum]|uniref:carboxyltransferase domain-containing protein n=1 Tax=Curtobacterium pusillum TaxID=69373 RepID=UPI0021B4DA98|nr:carboxyltransferase domain-containing protein [Curtobacterium pusillum]
MNGDGLDVRPAGTSALLVTVASLTEVVAFRAGLAAAPVPGVTEVVSGARTLLVRFDPRRTDPVRLRSALAAVDPRTVGPSRTPPRSRSRSPTTARTSTPSPSPSG